MSDYAVLSLFFSFFFTAFILSIVMVLGEATVQKEVVRSKKRKF